jgi:hypothetical protein
VNSGTVAKICNAEEADLEFKMRGYKLTEVPFCLIFAFISQVMIFCKISDSDGGGLYEKMDRYSPLIWIFFGWLFFADDIGFFVLFLANNLYFPN